jgi:hypothetical protein
MPSYAGFVAGIVRRWTTCARTDGDVLLVSSGGPISHRRGPGAGHAGPATIELNMRIRNSALTEFSFNPKRHVAAELQPPAAPGQRRVRGLDHVHLMRHTPRLALYSRATPV